MTDEVTTCPECGDEVSGDSTFCPGCGARVERRRLTEPSDANDLIGRKIFGEYEVVDRLGEGGMGKVYLARQQSIDQKMAVKVLHSESAADEETVQRFYREAKVISMLSHPNIVRVLVFGRTDDDLLLLALEYVDGVELRDEVDLGEVDELTATQIMKQCCSAVAEAHDLNIIHRDLKPGNILLTEFRGEKNFVKILDFGIAKLQRSNPESNPLTAAGTVHGTPEFISPEQAKDLELDGRSDIYALGCILYEMLTGRLPFQEGTGAQMLQAKVAEDPPPPSDFARIDPEMEAIVMKAIARDREERFDDALQMYDALVVREQELVADRDTNPGDTYVPGSELTGMHRSLELDALDAPPATTSVEHPSELGDDEAAPDPQPSDDSDSTPTRREDETSEDTWSPFVLYTFVAGLALLAVGLAFLLGYLVAS